MTLQSPKWRTGCVNNMKGVLIGAVAKAGNSMLPREGGSVQRQGLAVMGYS